jgi:hypothetical protein
MDEGGKEKVIEWKNKRLCMEIFRYAVIFGPNFSLRGHFWAKFFAARPFWLKFPPVEAIFGLNFPLSRPFLA